MSTLEKAAWRATLRARRQEARSAASTAAWAALGEGLSRAGLGWLDSLASSAGGGVLVPAQAAVLTLPAGLGQLSAPTFPPVRSRRRVRSWKPWRMPDTPFMCLSVNPANSSAGRRGTRVWSWSEAAWPPSWNPLVPGSPLTGWIPSGRSWSRRLPRTAQGCDWGRAAATMTGFWRGPPRFPSPPSSLSMRPWQRGCSPMTPWMFRLIA